MRLSLLVVIIVPALAFVAALYWLASFDICDTVIERQIPAPDNRYKLVIFKRDCGATVDFNTQVSLMPRDRSFSFDKYPAFFSIAGQHELNVRWLSSNRIRLVIPSGDRVYRQERSVGFVSIVY
jgi:hypothetical protein